MIKAALMFMVMLVLSTIAVFGQSQTEQLTVIFPDPNLESAIRDAIDKPEGAIYTTNLDSLKSLEASGTFLIGLEIPLESVENITGLEYCKNLIALNLANNGITDFSPLSNLTNLESLDLSRKYKTNLWRKQLVDISPLSGLTNLENLNLANNDITDVSPLSGLTNLKKLLLDGLRLKALTFA